MAQKFKHKETGDIIQLSRVRYYVSEGKVTSRVDLGGTYDLTQYDDFNEDAMSTSYETIKMTKSKTDGKGLR